MQYIFLEEQHGNTNTNRKCPWQHHYYHGPVYMPTGARRRLSVPLHRCQRPQVRELDELHPVCPALWGAEPTSGPVQRESVLRGDERCQGGRGATRVVRPRPVPALHGPAHQLPPGHTPLSFLGASATAATSCRAPATCRRTVTAAWLQQHWYQ